MIKRKSYKGLLVYNSESYITAKYLANLLNLRPIHKDLSIQKLSKQLPIKIRYGNSHEQQRIDTAYNSINTILLCSSSTAFSSFCQKHNIFSPVYTQFNPHKMPAFPFLLRDRYHRAGKDILVVSSEKDFGKLSIKKFDNRYWVPFIETKYEIRLHYILGEIIRIFLKQPNENSNINFPIRTTNYGWHYSLKPADDEERFAKAKELAIKVAKLIDLKFGAFDMAWVPSEKQYIIWEINTAPGLNKNTAEIYAERLEEVI